MNNRFVDSETALWRFLFFSINQDYNVFKVWKMLNYNIYVQMVRFLS